MGSGIEDPYQRFLYQVYFDSMPIAGFSKVTGLKTEVESVAYSEGTFGGHPIMLPGVMTPGEIGLERGLASSEHLWEWTRQVVNTAGARAPGISPIGTPERRPPNAPAGSSTFRKDFEIALYDRAAREVKRWKVLEAWVKTYELDDLDASSSDVVLEKLTIVHEGFYQL